MAGVQGDLSIPPVPPGMNMSPLPPPAAPSPAPVGAAATAPGPPQMDFSRGDALIAGMGDPLARTNSMIQQNRAALAPLQASVQQAGREYQQAASNAPPRPPRAAPDPQQGMGLQAAGEWVMIATGLGAIAGALTRRSTTNALAAFTGAMEGVAAGNKQAFEQNRVIWEQENKRINQQLQQDRDAYLDILNSKKMNWDMKVLELQQEAARRRDDVMMQLAAQRNVTAIAQRTDKLEELRVKGVQEYQRAQERLGKALGAGAQAGGLSDEAVKQRADLIRNGRPEAQVYRGLSRADITRVDNELASGGKSASDLNAAAQDYQGGIAGARSVGVRAENLKLAIRTADAAIPQALSASDQVWRTGFVPLNKLIQMSQQAGSSPELKAFAGSNIQLAEAWARAMKPTGALDVQLQTRALDYLNTADGPQAYKAAVKTIEQAIRREYGAVQAEQRHEPLPVNELPKSAAGAGTSSGGKPADIGGGWSAEIIKP